MNADTTSAAAADLPARIVPGTAEAKSNSAALGQAWFMVGALSLASMVSYIDRQILTLLFQPIKQDLALSDTEVSLLAGIAFVVFYATFGLLMGWLADRRNRKLLICWGIAFWSAATAACGLAQNFVQLFAARMAVGVGESTLSPSAMSMMSDAFPRNRLSRAMSVYVAASFIGMGLALVLGGAGIQAAMTMPPVSLPGVGELRPWQMAFMIVGLGGALAILPMLFVREPKRTGVPQKAADATPSAPAQGPAPKLGAFLLHNKWTFLCFFVGYSLNALSGMGTVAWLPTFFIRTHGWGAHEIGYAYGLVVAVVSLSGVLLGPRFAEWCEKQGLRDMYIRFPLICLTISAIPSAASFMVADANLAIGLIAIKQFIVSMPMALMSAALQLITPNQLRGRISALYLFIGNILAVAAGPVIVAVITDYIYQDEAKLGLSIITNIAVMVPVGMTILWLGIKPFRRSLEEAEAWASANEKG